MNEAIEEILTHPNVIQIFSIICLYRLAGEQSFTVDELDEIREMYDHGGIMVMVKGLIVNGSLKGADEYSFQSNFDFELPTQALWVTHKEWGITARWPVLLEKLGKKFS